MQPLTNVMQWTRFRILLITTLGLLAAGVAFLVIDVVRARRTKSPGPSGERSESEVSPARDAFGDLSVDFRSLALRALPSIVSIDAVRRPSRDYEGPLWNHTTGSGFVFGPAGVILTSSQLVLGAERVKVRLSDGSEYFASSVRMDPRSNVAVVQISPVESLTALPLGDSDLMQVGDWVMALGRTSLLAPTAATGIVKAVVPGPGNSRGEDFFQTDAAGSLDGDGGPLLNLNGQVIGIQSSVSGWDEDQNQVGLAVPSNLVNWTSRQLIDNGVVSRGFLGVTSQPMTPRLARQFRVPPGKGALVNRVLPNSAAADAGIHPGDVITQIDGKSVIDSRHLQSVTERLEPGRTYSAEMIRNGERTSVNFKAGRLPDPLNLKPRPPRADAGIGRKNDPKTFADLGLLVKNATPEQIRQAGFGDDVRGVMIDSVRPGSSAALAGLQKGMIIERIGQQHVTSVQYFNASEKDIAANNGVVLYVQTSRGPRFVAVGPDDI